MSKPCVKCLWNVKVLTCLFQARSVDKMNDQRTSYGVVEKYSLAQQIPSYTAFAFTMRKNWAQKPSTI